MKKVVGINDQNRHLIKVGSKCFNCKFLKALKITDSILSGELIVCGKQNKDVKNTNSYCKLKEEYRLELKVGDKVRTRKDLVGFQKYKGISYFDYMYLEEGCIEKIDEMYNKKVYFINGLSYTDEMIEKIE